MDKPDKMTTLLCGRPLFIDILSVVQPVPDVSVKGVLSKISGGRIPPSMQINAKFFTWWERKKTSREPGISFELVLFGVNVKESWRKALQEVFTDEQHSFISRIDWYDTPSDLHNAMRLRFCRMAYVHDHTLISSSRRICIAPWLDDTSGISLASVIVSQFRNSSGE